VVGVRAWIPGGARIERIPGQALVTGRSLTEGTARRDWREIADATEALGVAAFGAASFEVHGAAVDVRSVHWREGLDWAVELLTEPSFPEDRCRWMARQAASELESLRDQPEVRTAWAFLEQLYTPHPRSRPIQGDRESLARLTAEDCRRFHERALARAGLTLTVAGELDEEAVRAHVHDLLAGDERLRPSAVRGEEPLGPELPEPEPPVGLPERRRTLALPPGDQAHLYAGCLTVRRDHPDRHALELLAVILGAGAGLTGRLPERVREREGLAYAVHVQTLAGAGLDRGRLVVYVGTSPSTVEQAEASVVEELRRVVDDGVAAEEVDGARSYLLGRDPFRRETARQWADLMGEATLYGVPEDDPEWRIRGLEAVGPEEVTAAARRHLDPERLQVTVGLPRS
jgi:zinc protease